MTLQQEIVSGFVVNVHDALNYDIDLELTLEQRKLYQAAISHPYSYLEYSDSHGSSSGVGLAYRCRLEGISIPRQACESQVFTATVEQLIRRADAWVKCRLYRVDGYSRILVSLTAEIVDGQVDLRTHLMKWHPDLHLYNQSPSR